MIGLSDTSLRPLHADFESSGTIWALIRTCETMSTDFTVPSLPLWLFASRLDEIVGIRMETVIEESKELQFQAKGVIEALLGLEKQILAQTMDTGLYDTNLPQPDDSDHPCSVNGQSSELPKTCLARLMLGACCEAYISFKCSQLVRPGDRVIEGGPDEEKVTRFYKDGLLVATWTSAHATYLHDLINHRLVPSPPSIHTVPNESSELDFSDLYARRACPKVLCNCKDSACMLALMTRCTNPGSRGWNSVLKQALEKSEGSRRLCSIACTVSMTGMTSCIHPAIRMNWRNRLTLLNVLTNKQFSSIATLALKCPSEIKEVIRRMLLNCTSGSYATNAALCNVQHPLALIGASPLGLPVAGLEASASALALSGRAFLDSECKACLSECVKIGFGHPMVTPRPGGSSNALVWSCGYLGKGTASVHKKVPATSVVADVWSMAFRANFVPFWVHSSNHSIRASRLNESQYAAIHGMNSATNLTLLLSDNDRLQLQRVALNTPSIGVMTLEEVCGLLGISGVRGSSCNGGSKGSRDAVNTIGMAGPKNAARILSICRSAFVSEQILIYDLGPNTARMQASALLRRLLVNELVDIPKGSDPMNFLHLVPEHSKCLCACMQCKRVSNALASDNGYKKQTFDEIGTRCSMQCVDCSGSTGMSCAKRSSASMRAAMALEEEISVRSVEDDFYDERHTKTLLVDHNAGYDGGIAARARRDAKSSMEQHPSSVACGDECMISVPIIGRAIRMWGEWYTLCAFCGCFVRYGTMNRLGDQICCMRCDYRMLHRKEKQPLSAKDAASYSLPKCRFCGKENTQKTGSKWKLVRAPHDTADGNAQLPPPLRTVHFCPQHFRSWIPGCMKTLPTRVILSHIVFGARPLHGASPEDACQENDLKVNDAPFATRKVSRATNGKRRKLA